MPVEAANQYLPHSDRMEDAFTIVAKTHFSIGKTVDQLKRNSWEKIAQATGDFFTAGVAYLANKGHDAYMKEIGTTLWYQVNQHRVLPALVDNMRGAAIDLGVPPEIAIKAYSKNDEPHVLFLGKREGIRIIEVAYVLMPPEFVIKAQNASIEALATTTWIGSQVRDMANGRLTIDQKNINTRAAAAEAHFLLHAISLSPLIQLPPNLRKLTKIFPKGIYSLPESIWYKGSSGSEILQADNN